jgi:hypothetical protein
MTDHRMNNPVVDPNEGPEFGGETLGCSCRCYISVVAENSALYGRNHELCVENAELRECIDELEGQLKRYERRYR